MKTYELRIETSEMKRALDVMATVVNRKNAMPILADARIAYDRERKVFGMTASNGDMYLEMGCWRHDDNVEGKRQPWMFHDSHNAGDDKAAPLADFCVNVEMFREAFASIPALPANCKLVLGDDGEGGMLTVNYGKGEFTLPVDSAQDFPPVPAVVTKDGEQREGISALACFQIDAERLLPLVNAARCCVAADELRPQMCAVCVDTFQDRFVVVSSDGHSLFRQQVDMGMGWLKYGNFAADQSAKLLLPAPVLSPMQKALTGEEKITLTADTQRISIENGDGRVRLTFQVPEARYPNYETVIPKESAYKVVVDRMELTATLRRISPFSETGSNLCTMKREGDRLTLDTSDIAAGRTASEQVSIINPDSSLPDGFKMGFKIQTMQKLLTCATTESIQLLINDPRTAALLREEDGKSGLTLLIMPMIVNQ